jgi:hypothetical protein
MSHFCDILPKYHKNVIFDYLTIESVFSQMRNLKGTQRNLTDAGYCVAQAHMRATKNLDRKGQSPGQNFYRNDPTLEL